MSTLLYVPIALPQTAHQKYRHKSTPKAHHTNTDTHSDTYTHIYTVKMRKKEMVYTYFLSI